MTTNPTPLPRALPASHPKLSRHRYEVAAYSAVIVDRHPRRRTRLAGPFRYTSAVQAEAVAAHLLDGIAAADIVEVTLIAPADPRYPDGPWRTALVNRHHRPATESTPDQ